MPHIPNRPGPGRLGATAGYRPDLTPAAPPRPAAQNPASQPQRRGLPMIGRLSISSYQPDQEKVLKALLPERFLPDNLRK